MEQSPLFEKFIYVDTDFVRVLVVRAGLYFFGSLPLCTCMCIVLDKNVDIKLSAHESFQVCSKSKD